MNNATLMQVAEGIDDGTDDLAGFLLGVDHLLCDLIVEFSPR